ncbi:MAG TPA: response regulator [Lachnospiraceae bacterium]|nr:response regulator [Lachnospiraceae bacterium]
MIGESGKVVLISGSRGIIVKGVLRKLEDSGVDVVFCEPNVTTISAFEDTAEIFVLYLSDDVEELRETIVYLNDIIKEREKDMLIIGEHLDRQTLRLSIPDVRITEWYDRPLDLGAFISGVTSVLRMRKNRMTSKTILVVDDDPSFVRIIRDWLKTDYQVFIVTSGMQAISFLMKKNVDLVLLDYEMPVTTGPQVLRMLRSEPDTAHIPIVFLTGIGDAESVKQVISLKPDGYILKSTPKPDLLQWLKVFFASRM